MSSVAGPSLVNSRDMIRAIACLALPLLAVGCSSTEPTYADDVAFLRRHVEVIELVGDGGDRVAVVPEYQGRVMTSAVNARTGGGFGWINRRLIASGERLKHMNPFGGEDRFWLGPEGGQFGLYFAPDAPFTFEHWQTPAAIDTDRYEVVDKSITHVSFRHSAILRNRANTTFAVRIDRTIRLLDKEAIARLLGTSIGGLGAVGFTSDNHLTNAGRDAWTMERGAPSIWILGMYRHSPRTVVVIPYVAGDESALGPIVNADYFGRVPDDRLVVGDTAIFFRADGNYRSKIGLTPQRAKAFLGSWDGERGVLTIVHYDEPPGNPPYVNSMWALQDAPFAGDVVNSYNDGPPADGGEPLGPFYELETSSPAAVMLEGRSITHRHTTIHLEGDRATLDRVARSVLGVSLDTVENALP